MTTQSSPTEFYLTGQFLNFVFEQGKAKYIRVTVDQQELQLKLTKEARASLMRTPSGIFPPSLSPQEAINLVGTCKPQSSGEICWKVSQIQRSGLEMAEFPWVSIDLSCDSNTSCTLQGRTASPVVSPKKSKPSSKKAAIKILACQKSGCTKRGSNKQCQKLSALLQHRGLTHQVMIQETGCLGKCSMAPNLVLMPGKKRLSGLKPEAIVDLVEQLCKA
jgi:(2Fe-2S) ferredoxin